MEICLLRLKHLEHCDRIDELFDNADFSRDEEESSACGESCEHSVLFPVQFPPLDHLEKVICGKVPLHRAKINVLKALVELDARIGGTDPIAPAILKAAVQHKDLLRRLAYDPFFPSIFREILKNPESKASLAAGNWPKTKEARRRCIQYIMDIATEPQLRQLLQDDWRIFFKHMSLRAFRVVMRGSPETRTFWIETMMNRGKPHMLIDFAWRAGEHNLAATILHGRKYSTYSRIYRNLCYQALWSDPESAELLTPATPSILANFILGNPEAHLAVRRAAISNATCGYRVDCWPIELLREALTSKQRIVHASNVSYRNGFVANYWLLVEHGVLTLNSSVVKAILGNGTAADVHALLARGALSADAVPLAMRSEVDGAVLRKLLALTSEFKNREWVAVVRCAALSNLPVILEHIQSCKGVKMVQLYRGLLTKTPAYTKDAEHLLREYQTTWVERLRMVLAQPRDGYTRKDAGKVPIELAEVYFEGWDKDAIQAVVRETDSVALSMWWRANHGEARAPSKRSLSKWARASFAQCDTVEQLEVELDSMLKTELFNANVLIQSCPAGKRMALVWLLGKRNLTFTAPENQTAVDPFKFLRQDPWFG